MQFFLLLDFGERACSFAGRTAKKAALLRLHPAPHPSHGFPAPSVAGPAPPARDQLKALMDKVVDDREVVFVRRRQGGDVAMVAAEELEGLLERAHLLRSPRNANRLLATLERARSEDRQPL
ncbi:MAG: type II toxin-antitoxin system Phd/YefM family antitoxin [Cyanobium sp.]